MPAQLAMNQSYQGDVVAPQQANDPPAHRRQQARHLDVARRLAQRHEALRPVALLREDALGHERVLCGVRDYAEWKLRKPVAVESSALRAPHNRGWYAGLASRR
jgi:hypothetical protein